MKCSYIDHFWSDHFNRVGWKVDHNAFLSILRHQRCEIGSEVLPSLITPFVMPSSIRSTIARHAENLVSALEKLSRLRLFENQYEELLPIDPNLFELCQIPTHYSWLHPVVRVDALWDPATGDLKVLEFNCGDPSGIGWNDGLIDAQKSALFQQINLTIDSYFSYDYLCPSLAQTLKNCHMEFLKNTGIQGDSTTLCVALVCRRDSFITSDFQALGRRLLNLGFEVVFADPGDLVFNFQDDCLYFEDQKVDLIYRDIIDDFFGPLASPGSSGMMEALRKGKVCLINPIGSLAGDFKNILAVMHQSDFQQRLTENELESIQKCVPWTSQLKSNLVDMALQNQKALIVKPNLGFGGQEVYIGRDCSPDEWHRRIHEHLKTDLTVQEFVEIPEAYFPIIQEDGRVHFESRKFNLNLWVVMGKFQSAFIRISEHSVINVSQGGGLVPVAWDTGAG